MSQEYKVTATYFLSPKAMYAEEPVVDVRLDDATLFSDVSFEMAVNWSSTAGVPHHLPSMRERGRVSRGPGFVLISGNGWNVRYETVEYAEKQAKAIADSDWPTLTALCVPETTWFAEHGPL